MSQIDKFNVLDAKRQCQVAIAIAQKTEWGRGLPWKQMFIAGGFIASHLQKTTPKDVDFYCKTEQASQYVQNRLLAFQLSIKDVDEKYREIVGKDGKMVTEWAITMDTNHSFITKVWGEPKQIKSNFDFVHTCAHYDIATDQLVLSEATYVAATQKLLIVNNPDYVSGDRINKFLKRGYTKK